MSNINTDVVISSRIRLARNVKDIPFPNRMVDTDDSIKRIVGVNEKILNNLYGACDVYYMRSMPEVNRYSLVEMHLISPKLAEKTANGALVINFVENISIMINEEDHIRAQIIEHGYNLDAAYNKIAIYDAELSKALPIAFDDHYGYLTACPTNLGTAMRASVMLFLPALAITGKLDATFKLLNSRGLTIRGVYGEDSDSESFTYQISNRGGLGMTESEIINEVKSFTDILVKSEIDTRNKLKQEQLINLEDKIMRCFGVLANSRKLDTKELNDCIAYMRLGSALGIIEADIDKLDELHIQAQNNTLCMKLGKLLENTQERNCRRAEFVRGEVKNIIFDSNKS